MLAREKFMRRFASTLAHCLPYTQRQKIKAVPGILALQYLVFQRDMRSQFVTGATRICLEGFPRSGNGFAYACVRDILGVPQDGIAHHTHSFANVRRATQRRIPTFVLMREPLDCCLSAVLWGVCNTLEDAVSAYIQFHVGLPLLLERITIVPFEQLTGNPRIFLRHVARDTESWDFIWDERAAEFVKSVIREADERIHGDNVRRIILPSPEKESYKKDILARCLTPKAVRLLESARLLMTEIIAAAPSLAASSLVAEPNK